MAIINMTPHAVNIIEEAKFSPPIRKYRGGKILTTFAPSGRLLNARMGEDESTPIDGVPTKRMAILSADPIPEGDDFYIVSQLYLAAAREMGWNTTRLLTIGGAVVDDDGHIVGASFLIRN